MKKLITTSLAVLACTAVYALPVGNPADASLLSEGLFMEGHCINYRDPCTTWVNSLSFRLGFYGDYVFNHKMQHNSAPEEQLDTFQLFTNAAYLAVNIWDRVDLFSTLGATSFNAKIGTSSVNQVEPNLHINANFSWSLGVRATLWQCGCATLGAELQYFECSPHLTQIRAEKPGHDIDCQYRETQFGIGLAYRIHNFVPYIAIKWSGSQMDFGNHDAEIFGVLDSWENSQAVGFAVGLTIIDCERASATAEFRCGDEQAGYVNAQFRF